MWIAWKTEFSDGNASNGAASTDGGDGGVVKVRP